MLSEQSRTVPTETRTETAGDLDAAAVKAPVWWKRLRQIVTGWTHGRDPSSPAHVRVQIEEAIAAADEIKPGPNVGVVRTAFETWDKRNEIFLDRAFEKHGFLDISPKDDYASALGLTYPLGPALLTEAVVREVNEETRLLVERIGPLGRSPGWGLAPHCSAGPAIRAVIGPSSR
jgi:hypothetical protein